MLVVERLDRLSRQDARVVFALISTLTDAGLAIATVDGERLYTSETIDFASLIELIVKAQLANEESEKKSHRLAAAWKRKRERAAEGDGKAMTRRCPAWIMVNDQGSYSLIPERAAVVRRIFQLSIGGIGQHLIAATLNREGIGTWGRGALSSAGWHASYIQKILNSRSTIGEFQPRRRLNGTRVEEGRAIRGYFPAVIDEVEFNQARASRKARTLRGGRRGPQISNLLSGIARCTACGSVMTFRNKGKPDERYLVCDGALRGRGCTHRLHFNYPRLEAAVLNSVLHIVLTPDHFEAADEVRALELEKIEIETRLSELSEREARLIDLYSRNGSREIERQIEAIGEDLTVAKSAHGAVVDRLANAAGQLSGSEHIARVRKFRATLDSQDERERLIARGTVKQALAVVCPLVLCDPVAEEVTLVAPTLRPVFRFDKLGERIEIVGPLSAAVIQSPPFQGVDKKHKRASWLRA